MRAQLKKFIGAIGTDSIAIIPAAHEATRLAAGDEIEIVTFVGGG